MALREAQKVVDINYFFLVYHKNHIKTLKTHINPIGLSLNKLNCYIITALFLYVLQLLLLEFCTLATCQTKQDKMMEPVD